MKSLSRVQLFVTPWAVARQAPLSEEFSGQEYWSGLPFPTLGDLPNEGIEPASSAAKSLQSCLTLCDSVDGSPPGSSVPGILRARILEWVAISFSNACMLSRFSRVRLFATPWTVAHEAPPSMGFSGQEYWSGLPFTACIL